MWQEQTGEHSFYKRKEQLLLATGDLIRSLQKITGICVPHFKHHAKIHGIIYFLQEAQPV
jgi:hypothetical protein